MSLRRVSSRQRLVSWDAFDAQTVNCSEESGSSSDEFSEDYQTCLVGSTSHTSLVSSLSCEDEQHPLKRKRGTTTTTARSLNEPTVIPNDDGIEDAAAQKKLLVLPTEVQLQALKFLDLDDLRSVMQVNTTNRQLLTEPETSVEEIWKPAYQRQFPWLSNLQDCDLVVQDTVITESDINHSVLLSMANSGHPTEIDQTLFCRYKLRRSSTRMVPRTTSQLQILPDGISVQFTGTVGIGDRCIRANAPLPRPSKKQTVSFLTRIRNHHRMRRHHHHHALEHRHYHHHHNSSPILCRVPGSLIAAAAALWKPFVAPMVVDENGAVDVTPRLISYFEVSILKEEDAEQPPLQQQRPRPLAPALAPGQQPQRRTPACVAIGLATGRFHLHSRMPGWDVESFGWHGDDGGIFHNDGSMIRNFGRSFGSNDTVGCGVDYYRQAIFYTRNGSFCGYAFDLKDHFLTQDLYPVVGMDTNCPVRCNFGIDRPFMFDVLGMMEKQKEVVQSSLHYRET